MTSGLRSAALASLIAGAVVGCGAHPPPPTCTELFGAGPGPTDEASLQSILTAARGRFYSSLDGVEIDLVADPSQYYFATNLDVTTLQSAPRDRHYQVHYNPALLMDPPSQYAIGAILVHEVKHVVDYLDMDSDQLAQFGVWYATSDVDDYEHATDLASLEAGCGDGLKAFRIWLYAHVSSSLLVAKQAEYYTPDQIDAWMAANPNVH